MKSFRLMTHRDWWGTPAWSGPHCVSIWFYLSAVALCDMSLEGPTIGMCFSSREIGPGPVELVFEVKIVFANALSLSPALFFFFLIF